MKPNLDWNFFCQCESLHHLELCLISKKFQASRYTFLTNFQISNVCNVFTRHAPCTHLVLTIRVPNHLVWPKRVMKRFFISNGPVKLQFLDPGVIWKVTCIWNDELSGDLVFYYKTMSRMLENPHMKPPRNIMKAAKT